MVVMIFAIFGNDHSGGHGNDQLIMMVVAMCSADHIDGLGSTYQRER